MSFNESHTLRASFLTPRTKLVCLDAAMTGALLVCGEIGRTRRGRIRPPKAAEFREGQVRFSLAQRVRVDPGDQATPRRLRARALGRKRLALLPVVLPPQRAR